MVAPQNITSRKQFQIQKCI